MHAGVFEQGLQRMPCSSVGGKKSEVTLPVSGQPSQARAEERTGCRRGAVPREVLAERSLPVSLLAVLWVAPAAGCQELTGPNPHPKAQPGTVCAVYCRQGGNGTMTAAPSSP